MPVYKIDVLWEKEIEGERYRCLRELGHPNDAVNYVGSLRIEKYIVRPDGAGFWHSVHGEAILPGESTELHPMYGSFAEVVAMHPAFLLPELFNTKADVEEFLAACRTHVVDRFLERASETFGKYWSPERAAKSKAETLAFRESIKAKIAEIQYLLDQYGF